MDVIFSCREEKLDKLIKKEEFVGYRKWKVEGEGFRVKEKIVEEYSKDRWIKKEEINFSFREERLDKKMKKEDFIVNRKIRVEGEFFIIEMKIRIDRDGCGVDIRMKVNRERFFEKIIEK